MHSVKNTSEGMTHARPLIPDIPFHPGLIYMPPPKPVRPQMSGSHESSQNSDSSGSTISGMGYFKSLPKTQ